MAVGLVIGSMIDSLRHILDCGSCIDYGHVSIHDNDLGLLLGALHALRKTIMAAKTAFKKLQMGGSCSRAGDLSTRVLYSGQPIKTIRYSGLDFSE